MAPAGCARPQFILDAGDVPQLVDALVELALGELDFLPRAFFVEQTGAHRDRDLVQIADLHENVVGDPAQADESPLLGKRAAVAEPQLIRRQAPREV